MLSIGLIDANIHAGGMKDDESPISIVGRWLEWELKRYGIILVSPDIADVLLIVFSGMIGFASSVKRQLTKVRANLSAYKITGGAISANWPAAFLVCDALAVGEAYEFIREIGKIISGNGTVQDIKRFILEYPNAIEKGQVADIKRDSQKPWLLDRQYEIVATPNSFIDWNVPPIKPDDGVIRVIGSKGCHSKCLFCSTSFAQEYQYMPEQIALAEKINFFGHNHKVQLLSNDPADLHSFRLLKIKLDSNSFTIKSLRNPDIFRSLLRSKSGMVRIGVEGVSERLRRAVGKPIMNDELFRIVLELADHKFHQQLFFISGLPFENDSDWLEMMEFNKRLAVELHSGLLRLKFTTYNPTPPAPLCRFVPPRSIFSRYQEFAKWRFENAVSRWMYIISGIGNRNKPGDTGNYGLALAELLNLSRAQADSLMQSDNVFDLAPTFDEFKRMPHNIIGWPIDASLRYRMTEIYKRRTNIVAEESSNAKQQF